MKSKKLVVWLLLLPSLIFFAGMLCYPVIYLVKLSLHQFNFANPGVTTKFIGLKNFFLLFQDFIFLTALKNTFFFVAIATTIQFIFGMGIALLLSVTVKGRGISVAILLMPTIMARVVVGVLWRFMYNSEFGIITYCLNKIGFLAPGEGMLTSAFKAMIGVIITDIWQWTPFIALILFAGLTALPKELYEAGKVDGASKLQLFRYVTVPLLRPLIVIVLFIRIVDATKTFDKIYVLTRGGPGYATELINVFCYKMNFIFFNMGYGSAAVLVLFFMVLVLGLFMFKYLRIFA